MEERTTYIEGNHRNSRRDGRRNITTRVQAGMIQDRDSVWREKSLRDAKFPKKRHLTMYLFSLLIIIPSLTRLSYPWYLKREVVSYLLFFLFFYPTASSSWTHLLLIPYSILLSHFLFLFFGDIEVGEKTSSRLLCVHCVASLQRKEMWTLDVWGI
jgi:hypothetical protein